MVGNCRSIKNMIIFNIVEYKSYLNHHDTVKYVGMNECKACHYEIYNSYIQTGMGRSFSSAIKTKSSLPESPEIIYDSIKDLSYMPLWIMQLLILMMVLKYSKS